MKRKLILSLAFILTLTGGINLSIKKNYASNNEITELAKSLKETANKIIPNSSLIKYVNDTLVFFNGEQVTDLSIYNYNNSTYLPLRAIGDLLGAKVNWFAEDMVAQVSLDNTQIEVLNNTNTVVVKKDDNIEESKITANSNGQSVDLPALNIGGSIYLPLRYISETLGVNIDYTSNHEKTGVKTIEIYKGNKPELNYVRDIPLFPVMVESTGNGWGYWGFIDNTGKLVIPKAENTLMLFEPKFSEGLAKIHNGTGSYYYFIDKTGELAFPYGFDSANNFSEGLAVVEKDGKYYYINKEGKLGIPYEFDYASSFSEGLAAVEKDGKQGYINKEGEMVITYNYYSANEFSEGLALIQEEKLFDYKFIDKSGKIVIDASKYDQVDSFKEGLAAVKINNKVGYIDKTGKLVIPCIYEVDDMNRDFSEGLVSIHDEKTGNWGCMDKTGKIVIPCIYDGGVGPFRDGLALTLKDNTYSYIDKTGKTVISLENIISASDFENGLAYIRPEEGGSYYIDKTGKKVSNYYRGK